MSGNVSINLDVNHGMVRERKVVELRAVEPCPLDRHIEAVPKLSTLCSVTGPIERGKYTDHENKSMMGVKPGGGTCALVKKKHRTAKLL